MRNKNLRFLTLGALFAAMEIVVLRLLPLYFYLPPGTFEVRVSAQFAVHGMCGWLLGPWYAIGSAVAADLLGTFLNPAGFGAYFYGYTLSAALSGLIYGVFLYKKPPALWRCAASVSLQTVLCGLALGALWANITRGAAWLSVVYVQTPIRLALIPVYAVALFALQRAIPRRLRATLG